jgi:hypothetical protein
MAGHPNSISSERASLSTDGKSVYKNYSKTLL